MALPGPSNASELRVHRPEYPVSISSSKLESSLKRMSKQTAQYEYQMKELEHKFSESLSNFRAIDSMLQEAFTGLKRTSKRADRALNHQVPTISHDLEESLKVLTELNQTLPTIRTQVLEIRALYDSGRDKAQTLVSHLRWLNTGFYERWRIIIFTSSSPVSSQWKMFMRVDKGKGRAPDPTERTPLLAQSSSSSATEEDPSSTPVNSRSTLLSILLRVFLGSLLLCIIAFVVAALLTWSYVSRTSGLSPDDILHEAVVFEGPRRVNILNATWSDGLWVEVEGRVGVDAGSVIGVNRGDGDGFFEGVWKSFGRWGIKELHEVSAKTSTIYIRSQQDPSVVLASLDIPPLEVPLTSNPPVDHSWLTPISTPVLIHPTQNTTALVQFAREAWKSGAVNVRADVANVDVQGGSLDSGSWRNLLHRAFSDVRSSVRLKIPPLPGLPHPGRNTPFPSVAELITLSTFNLSTSADHLHVQAVATVVDPAPLDFDVKVPSLPFIVSLPSNTSKHAPIASVNTESFNLTHPNITLDITGHVLPLQANTLSLLSTFISKYLSGIANPITITTPIATGLSVDAEFPAPAEKPRILRNVTIRDMKIKPGNTFTASGTVFARVVLPKGMNIELDVKRVLPDVLVFDGEVPDSVHIGTSMFDDPPPRRPLPDPIPEKAFGHIRPDDWLVSSCEATEPKAGEGAEFTVTAKIVDVPLEVLPGRHTEFSDFVSKVIFGRQGAVAGILGTADVGVTVKGLPVDGPGRDDWMVLSNLPFKGSVRVGKKSMLTSDVDKWMDRFRQ
ncbi:hypothetical protein V5O48_005718 [Marasmius crinis-equi]|uniref:Transmembrane protein n=1 Tax=Marasmius crinis-equi TaxID=585013 RepID=A0ABR3FLS7_9AGAR